MLYRPFKTKPSKYIEHSDKSDYYFPKTEKTGKIGKTFYLVSHSFYLRLPILHTMLKRIYS